MLAIARCAAVLLILATMAPRVAAAHAILVESTPAIGGTADAGQVTVRLRFNSRIDHARSRLTLTRPDHSQVVMPAGSDDRADMMTSQVDLPPGSYSLRWQVLAIDGHITRGDVPFTLVAPTTAATAGAHRTGG